MASRDQQYVSTFPAVPSSLSTDDHGMRDYYATQDQTTATRNNVHSLEDLSPYLGLRARLSQVWLNKWTILILLVLARVLIAIGNLHDDIDNAEAKALSACTSVEAMGSTMASMPHYLAEGTNELAAKGITHAVDGLQQMLFLSITAIEQIFLFVINMMYGTYECLITFAVTGSAHLAISLLEDATTAINNTIADITKDMQNTANTFENGLNDFLKGISSVGSIFGGSSSPPTLNLAGGFASLNGIQLPGSINDNLNKINNSIPNFDEVHNFTNSVLSLPFEEVKKLLNQSLGVYTFDQSILPVPQKQNLQFCTNDTNSGITDFFDQLYNVADVARKVFIAILLLAALLCCIPFAMLEIRRWRKMNERAKLIRSGIHEPMDVIYIVSRPITAGLGLSAAHRFGSPKRQVLTRWFVAYITSTPALLVLAIALAGLFSCLCQYILLKSIEKEVPVLAAEVGHFADQVVDALNNASNAWSNSTNAAILSENAKINNDVFGWVNTTTSALNQTLNTFINETTLAINKVFGGTPLEEPVKEVFNCLIGLKVAAVEQGLTWASDNAQVNFPLFPNNLFSAGASKALAADSNNTGINSSGDSFLATPGSNATDAITGAVVDLTEKLYKGIQNETYIAAGVLLCYVAVVLMGAGWTAFRCCSARSSLRGNGGITYAGDVDTLPQTGSVQNTNQYSKSTGEATAQPIVKNTATGPVYDWGSKASETGTIDRRADHRESHGVIGSYNDPVDDEKSSYPAF
ncbi:MAG: hypothetical protein GOMPHAMPRED_005487 [Gomphillus americanus]|uniref:Plasma membrane fusion protein PRM1 n=1 Tax=Gomphillus americanus TaxID=1940652 RepID=A0A8H3FVC8_9LECA|nr:MAG: hypothetical protein GOMPHAMPRED_005487 [Gomphillus americanus]